MALAQDLIRLYLELYQRGLLKNMQSVMEIGSQEIIMQQVDFEDLIQAAGISNYVRENFTPWNWPARPRCSSKPFFEMLGAKDYSCIDLDEMHGAIPLDLNLPLEDKSLYNRYDLVTDHGCNEHVFNVAEAYRTMHRLCKPQGIMVICQQVWGGNGYFLFDLSFFEGIAAANNYKILYASYIVRLNVRTSSGSDILFHLPLSRELLNTMDLAKIPSIGICYALEKQSDADFQYPYQGALLSQSQGHEGYKLQFWPDVPGRTYLPVYSPDTYLDTVGTKALLKYVYARLKKKVGLSS